jgi:hypothetical protein
MIQYGRDDNDFYIEFKSKSREVGNIRQEFEIRARQLYEEKDNIVSKDFSLLWNQLWNKNENEKNDNIQYNTEEFLSFDKITSLKHGIHNNNDYVDIFCTGAATCTHTSTCITCCPYYIVRT